MKRLIIPIGLALCSSLVSSRANTYVVTSTVDPGPGSLSQAILDANSNPGPDIIKFQFPAYPVTITPTVPLPDILDEVVIDATDPSICVDGTKPRVNLDGAALASVSVPGLAVRTALPVTIKGLAIYRFFAPGILLEGNTGSTIAGNHLGTDASGSLVGVGNMTGILLTECHDVVVGGAKPCERNVISGNRGGGVDIHGGAHNQVLGNYIGPAASGTWALPNQYGVLVTAGTQHQIGSTSTGEANVISGNAGDGVTLNGPLGLPSNNNVEGNYIGTRSDGGIPLPNTGAGVYFFGGPTGDFVRYNVIRFNGSDGVLVLEGTDDTIVENSISDNARLGIDITPAFAVNPNDVMDVDAGPNRQQNYPSFYIVLPPMTGADGTTVRFDFNSEPMTTFRLDFYWSPSCDPSGYGEGAHFFGSTNVTTDAFGNIGLTTMTFPVTVPLGCVLTATATHPGGSTSEFSPCSMKVVASSANIVTHAGLMHSPIGQATLAPRADGALQVSVNGRSGSNGVQITLGSAEGWMGTFNDLQMQPGAGLKVEYMSLPTPNQTVQWIGSTELRFPAPGMAEITGLVTPARPFMLRVQLLDQDGKLLDSTLIPNGGSYPTPLCSSSNTLHVLSTGVLQLSSGTTATYWQFEDDWCGTRPPGPRPPHWKRLIVFPELTPATPGARVVAKDPICDRCPVCCIPYYIPIEHIRIVPDPPCDCPWQIAIGPEVLQVFRALHQTLGATMSPWLDSQGPRPHPWLPGTLTVQSLDLTSESTLDLLPTGSSLPLPPTDGGVDPHDASAVARYVSVDFNATSSTSAVSQYVRFIVDGPVPVGPGDPVEYVLGFQHTEQAWAVSANFGAGVQPMAEFYFHGQRIGEPMPWQGLQVPSLPARVAASASLSPFGAPGWALVMSDPMPAASGPQPLPWDEVHIILPQTAAGNPLRVAAKSVYNPLPWYLRFRVKYSGVEEMTITSATTLPAHPGPLSIQRLQGAARLAYPTEMGRLYRIEYADSLVSSAAWQRLEDFTGDGAEHILLDQVPQTLHRFYRLVGF